MNETMSLPHRHVTRPPGLGLRALSAVTNGGPTIFAAAFLIYAAVAVLLFAVLVPPLQNADEAAHFSRATQIASGGLIAGRVFGGTVAGGIVDQGVAETDAGLPGIRAHYDSHVSRQMLRRASTIQWGVRGEAGFPNTALYPPFCYFPAAIGILAGKALHMSVVATLVLARLLNGLCCVAIAATAIACADGMAAFLFIVLCLPMTLSLFAAVSQDGLMIACAALAASLTVRLVSGTERHPARLSGLVCACVGIVALARPPYVALAAIPLGWRFLPVRRRMLLPAMIVLAVLLWMVVVKVYVETAAPSDSGADPVRQMHAVLAHPGFIFSIIGNTITGQWPQMAYVHEFIGVLGSLNVPLPRLYYPLAGAVIVIGFGVARPAVALDRNARRLLLGALLATACGIFAALYLTWTPVGADRVDGVQGRYFLPLAMFTPLLLRGRPQPAGNGSAVLRVALLAFPALSVAIAAVSIVFRFYLWEG